VELVDRVLGIGDIYDHHAVLLNSAALERIWLRSPMSANEGDRPAVGVNDDVRLVRWATLQVGMPGPSHVPLLVALPLCEGAAAGAGDQNSDHRSRCKGALVEPG
jgi:hypothetical protein